MCISSWGLGKDGYLLDKGRVTQTTAKKRYTTKWNNVANAHGINRSFDVCHNKTKQNKPNFIPTSASALYSCETFVIFILTLYEQKSEMPFFQWDIVALLFNTTHSVSNNTLKRNETQIKKLKYTRVNKAKIMNEDSNFTQNTHCSTCTQLYQPWLPQILARARSEFRILSVVSIRAAVKQETKKVYFDVYQKRVWSSYRSVLPEERVNSYKHSS